jgi:hypothetical protein
MAGDTVIFFTLNAAPCDGGGQMFRSGIERIVSHGVGDAVFSVVDVSDTSAVLRGKMVSDVSMASDHRLAEYLDNTLVPQEGIRLDFEVQIQTDNPPHF